MYITDKVGVQNPDKLGFQTRHLRLVFRCKFMSDNRTKLPGPASLVEDRSLRKNFVRGDRGSKLAVGDFFSDALSKHKYRTSQQLSQPR